MGFLRSFLFDDVCNDLSSTAVSDLPKHFKTVSIIFNGVNVTNFLAQTHYVDLDYLGIDDDEDTISYDSYCALSPDDMLEKLGFYGLHDIDLKNHNNIFIHASDKTCLGIAVQKQSCGFAQSIIYELGNDQCHIQLKIKDRWDGSYFPTQIDKITIWNKKNQYDVPISMPFVRGGVEDILGIVDVTTQALLNGDDEVGYRNFALMNEIIQEFEPLLDFHHIKRLTFP